MILESKLNIRKGLENLLSKIPVDNVSSRIVESAHTEFVRKANMSLYEKLWFLDKTMKSFNQYKGVPEVQEWLNETNAFFRNNNLSVQCLSILETLRKSTESDFYVDACNILENLLIVNDEKTLAASILESKLKDYNWISDVRHLLSNAVIIKKGVDFTNPNFDISDVYSPIQTIAENDGESYIFYSNGRLLKLNEQLGFSEYKSNVLENEFRSIVKVIDNKKLTITDKSVYGNVGSRLLKVEETAKGEKRITIDGETIQPSMLEATIFANTGFLGSSTYTTECYATVFENFNQIYNLDFAKSVKNIHQKHLTLNVFRYGNNVALQKINTNLMENSFIIYTDAEEAIQEAVNFIGFNLTSLFSDLVEVGRQQKVASAEKVREIQESVVILKSRRDSFRAKAIEQNVIDTKEVQATLQSLQESIDSKIDEMDNLLPNSNKFGKIMVGLLETNLGEQEVTFLSNDYISEETNIKVKSGDNIFYVDKKYIKI